jgi:hypothetical protein
VGVAVVPDRVATFDVESRCFDGKTTATSANIATPASSGTYRLVNREK